MARDLSFWKYEKEGVLNDEQVYTLLSDGEEVKGVEVLPVKFCSCSNYLEYIYSSCIFIITSC